MKLLFFLISSVQDPIFEVSHHFLQHLFSDFAFLFFWLQESFTICTSFQQWITEGSFPYLPFLPLYFFLLEFAYPSILLYLAFFWIVLVLEFHHVLWSDQFRRMVWVLGVEGFAWSCVHCVFFLVYWNILLQCLCFLTCVIDTFQPCVLNFHIGI